METIRERERNLEVHIKRIDGEIDKLKLQYNLFFSGEINIPPEKERENMEKEIRHILNSNLKSPRVNLLLQNLSSKFSLYNSLWKKKLNMFETGQLKRPVKTTGRYVMRETNTRNKNPEVSVSLNDEQTFENLFEKLSSIDSKNNPSNKESIINKIKLKLISENIIDAKVELSKTKKGKVQVKIKK